MNISKEIIAAIHNNTQIVFAKFGDGEYNCMFAPSSGSNCDRDLYSPRLSSALKSALVNYC
jgi:hypothetical protein